MKKNEENTEKTKKKSKYKKEYGLNRDIYKFFSIGRRAGFDPEFLTRLVMGDDAECMK